MAGFGDINPKEETPEKLQYADKGIGISKFQNNMILNPANS